MINTQRIEQFYADEIEEMVAQNMEPRRTLAREMQRLFPGKALEHYIFMIEENINFNFLSSQPMATIARQPPPFQQQHPLSKYLVPFVA